MKAILQSLENTNLHFSFRPGEGAGEADIHELGGVRNTHQRPCKDHGVRKGDGRRRQIQSLPPPLVLLRPRRNQYYALVVIDIYSGACIVVSSCDIGFLFRHGCRQHGSDNQSGQALQITYQWADDINHRSVHSGTTVVTGSLLGNNLVWRIDLHYRFLCRSAILLY